MPEVYNYLFTYFIEIITGKVSNGDPYINNENKGENAVGLWVNKMKNQVHLSLVEVRIVTYVDDLKTSIDLSVPRRKWSGLGHRQFPSKISVQSVMMIYFSNSNYFINETKKDLS